MDELTRIPQRKEAIDITSKCFSFGIIRTKNIMNEWKDNAIFKDNYRVINDLLREFFLLLLISEEVT